MLVGKYEYLYTYIHHLWSYMCHSIWIFTCLHLVKLFKRYIIYQSFAGVQWFTKLTDDKLNFLCCFFFGGGGGQSASIPGQMHHMEIWRDLPPLRLGSRRASILHHVLSHSINIGIFYLYIHIFSGIGKHTISFAAKNCLSSKSEAYIHYVLYITHPSRECLGSMNLSRN